MSAVTDEKIAAAAVVDFAVVWKKFAVRVVAREVLAAVVEQTQQISLTQAPTVQAETLDEVDNLERHDTLCRPSQMLDSNFAKVEC